MKRRLFNLAAALSLLLCVVTAGLWVRSYYSADSWRFRQARPQPGQVHLRTLYLTTSRGVVEIFHASGIAVDTTIPPLLPRGHVTTPAGRMMFDGSWRWSSSVYRPGFVAGHAVRAQRTLIVNFPLWSLVVAFSLVPAWRLTSVCRDWRRKAPAHCRTCGYDLRATPDRCPECGTVPASARVSN